MKKALLYSNENFPRRVVEDLRVEAFACRIDEAIRQAAGLAGLLLRVNLPAN